MCQPGGIFCIAAVLCLLGSAAMAQPATWNVLEAGARGDGKTDDTAAFQAALDAAGRAGGGAVIVPAGKYRIAGNLTVPSAVCLQGTHRVPPTLRDNRIEALEGSVLLAYAGRGKPDGEPFIKLTGTNSSVVGFIITYPEWRQTDVPPVPYPPCIGSYDSENVAVQECLLLNAYEGIRMVRAHRHLIRNITGYPSKRGIYVDECYDIGHIENVHFWPFGVAYAPDNPYCKWVNTQGVAFELARTDWHYVSNTFCFGYGVGYKFSESKSGSTNGNFLGIGADSCQRAVLVEQCQPPGILIVNGEFVGRWSSKDAVTLEVGPKCDGKVSLTNCSFWGPIDRCIVMKAPNGQLTANACNFVSWDIDQKRSPAIQIDAGKAIVQGCTFGSGDLHVTVGRAAKSVILLGNQGDQGFVCENRAGARTQAYANQVDPIQWTASARAAYRVTVGAEGDSRYLREFHGRERLGKGAPYRWSAAASRLVLPVNPHTAYTLKVDLEAPAQSIGPDAGIYLGSRRLAAITRAGVQTVVAELPASHGDQVVLTLRLKGWVPRATMPGSQDDRTLGAQVHSLVMLAAGRRAPRFDANTGAAVPGGQ